MVACSLSSFFSIVFLILLLMAVAHSGVNGCMAMVDLRYCMAMADLSFSVLVEGVQVDLVVVLLLLGMIVDGLSEG